MNLEKRQLSYYRSITEPDGFSAVISEKIDSRLDQGFLKALKTVCREIARFVHQTYMLYNCHTVASLMLGQKIHENELIFPYYERLLCLSLTIGPRINPHMLMFSDNESNSPY